MPKRSPSAFDPRAMMEKAVEVMRLSLPEHRPDGSPSPLVGAVIVRPEGSVETAARGELRAGNHFEWARQLPAEPADEPIKLLEYIRAGCQVLTASSPSG